MRSAEARLSKPATDRRWKVPRPGTLNVVEAAGRCRAPVVFTSTGGALYGDDAPRPTPEDQPPLPLSPYGASKLAGEAYVKTWSASSGLPHAVCRLGNVYGPRQNPHGEAGVVAIFAHHLLTGQAPTLYGHGKPTRDYVHVQDIAQALLMAVGHGGVLNVSTGVETPVSALFDILANARYLICQDFQPAQRRMQKRALALEHPGHVPAKGLRADQNQSEEDGDL